VSYSRYSECIRIYAAPCTVVGQNYLCFSDFSSTTVDGVFETFVIPVADGTESAWTEYVYRIYNGSDVNETHCTAMCAFDMCHFVVFATDQNGLNNCYLGTLGNKSSVVSTGSGPQGATIELKIG
jgi:hypothetical protein